MKPAPGPAFDALNPPLPLLAQARDRASAALESLAAVSAARRELRSPQLRGDLSAFPPEGPLGAAPNLLQRLAKRLVEGEEIPEVTHVPSSLGGLLRTGFGLFGLQARPAPRDHATAVLFVVGGVSAGELRDVKEARCVLLRMAQSVHVSHARISSVFVVATYNFLYPAECC